MLKIQDHIGNYELLRTDKTAFLCSRKVSAMAVLKCYDWAIEQRLSGLLEEILKQTNINILKIE